ncbi:MAG: DUF2905 domain-containing protein [Thermogutta sp.]|nr:DUF2905 domain-containing protein [Thermogutta sp.]
MSANLFERHLLAGILIVLVMAGVILVVVKLLGFGLGRLPGDIVLRGRGWTFYFPVATCLLLSLLLTVVINFLARWWR